MIQRLWRTVVDGPIPSITSRRVDSHLRLFENDGTEWYAIESDGQLLRQTMIVESSTHKIEREAAHAKFQAEVAKQQNVENRKAAMREKRRRGEALTAAERTQLLDDLLGV